MPIMKKTLSYLLLVILASSCKKDKINDYVTEFSSQGIVGKWRLVEIMSSDGANISRVNMEAKNYLVTFELDGDVLSSDLLCAGRYEFDSAKQGIRGGRNLRATFEECSTSNVEWYSIKGTADASFSDSNTLLLSFDSCDEPCIRTFRRLKR